jgi:hypothetical protein
MEKVFEKVVDMPFKSSNPLLDNKNLLTDEDVTKEGPLLFKPFIDDDEWMGNEAALLGMKGILKMLVDQKRPMEVLKEYLGGISIREMYIGITMHTFLTNLQLVREDGSPRQIVMDELRRGAGREMKNAIVEFGKMEGYTDEQIKVVR